MNEVTILAPNEVVEQLEASERLPQDIDPDTLRKYFTLTRPDLEQVDQCRGATNKLGFAVQLCTLRWRGHFSGSEGVLRVARPFRFGAYLLHQRRRDHIRQQHRRNQHRADDRLRAAQRNVACDPNQRKDRRQHRLKRQLQHFEHGDTRGPDTERR